MKNTKKRLSVVNGRTANGFTYTLRADRSYRLVGVSDPEKLCCVEEQGTGQRQIVPTNLALAYVDDE